MLIKLCISESPIEMELDTGAALSLLSIKALKSKLGENYYIHLFNGKLKTYSGEIIQLLGIACTHELGNSSKTLPIIVTEQHGPTLLGCRCLDELKLHVHFVFADGLGQLKNIVVYILVEPDAEPK